MARNCDIIHGGAKAHPKRETIWVKTDVGLIFCFSKSHLLIHLPYINRYIEKIRNGVESCIFWKYLFINENFIGSKFWALLFQFFGFLSFSIKYGIMSLIKFNCKKYVSYHHSVQSEFIKFWLRAKFAFLIRKSDF